MKIYIAIIQYKSTVVLVGAYSTKKEAEKGIQLSLRDMLTDNIGHSTYLHKKYAVKDDFDNMSTKQLIDLYNKAMKSDGEEERIILSQIEKESIASPQLHKSTLEGKIDTKFIDDLFEIYGKNVTSKLTFKSLLKRLKDNKRDASKWKNRFEPEYKIVKSKTGKLMHYCIQLVEKKKRISKDAYVKQRYKER